MFQFKFVSKMRANGWFSEAMFVSVVVIDLVSFISIYLSIPVNFCYLSLSMISSNVR